MVNYNSSNLFSNLTNAIIYKNKVFEIYGKNYFTKDGTAVRDFIHLEDLSDIHVKCLSFLKKIKQGEFNIKLWVW